MELDKVTAELRPRNPWEATDLGVVLWRANLKAIYLPWLLSVVPFSILIFWMLREHPITMFFVFWWFKPLYDRLVLFVLSRSLFGAAPTVRESLRAIPSLFGTGLLWGLTTYRLDPTRSFNLPVWQLEGLRGGARWNRATVLQDDARGHAVGLTVAGLHLEQGFALALAAFCIMILPTNMQGDFFALFIADEGHLLTDVLGWLTYVIALSVIEPIYVACGFALYLNRRTRLEGWDIELAFRRLAQRLETTKQNDGAGVKVAKLEAGR